MQRLLNTLYVTTQGAYLAKDGEAVAVRVEHETRLRVPLHGLGGVVCFGQVGASPALLGACAEEDVGVSFLTENGRFLASVRGPVSGNVLLRRAQYRRADAPEGRALLARCFVQGKILNARAVVRRAVRDHGDGPDEADACDRGGGPDGTRRCVSLEAAALGLTDMAGRAARAPSDDVARGIEGEAAAAYFGVFNELILPRDEAFVFGGRSRRPPLDAVNCLLSFIYTLLAHDIRSALEAVGLDPQVGYLHRDRPGRPSLALDVMEEFRPWLADRLVLSLINRRQVKPGDFTRGGTGGVVMKDEARKTVLVAWQNRKQEEVTHPFIDEKVAIGLLPHVQAMLLARHLRGELDGYPPFLWR